MFVYIRDTSQHYSVLYHGATNQVFRRLRHVKELSLSHDDTGSINRNHNNLKPELYIDLRFSML